MEKKSLKNVLIVTIVIAFATLVSNAYARMGMGGGGGMQGEYGSSFYSNLTDKQIEEFNQERSVFFKATGDLRQSIYQKRLELESEMAKKNPSIKKAKKLQNQLSGLQAQLDNKRIEHQIRMRKINPNYRAHGSMGCTGGSTKNMGSMGMGCMGAKGAMKAKGCGQGYR